jgi:hypothetical protein
VLDQSPEKHFDASVKSVEEKLAKDGLRPPSKCPTPMFGDHHPSDDTSAELTAAGVHWSVAVGGGDWKIGHAVGSSSAINAPGIASTRPLGTSAPCLWLLEAVSKAAPSLGSGPPHHQ